MSAAVAAPAAPPEPAADVELKTVAEILDGLGGVPADRVIWLGRPATEADVVALGAKADMRPCELINGFLVEKAVGYRESLLALRLAHLLDDFVLPRNLGLITGEQGMLRLFPGRIRLPDVAFIAWDRIPGGRVPEQAAPDLAPTIAVEVLGASNTRTEMILKREDYFGRGTRLHWEIDPVARTVDVYTSATAATRLTEADTLDGGGVLPGFALPLRTLFAELDRTAPPAGGPA